MNEKGKAGFNIEIDEFIAKIWDAPEDQYGYTDEKELSKIRRARKD